MTASLHQRAKEIFAEVYDLPPEECERRLSDYASQSPELIREVRSLLAYRTESSQVIGEPQIPKIRTRSTLSTTFQSRSGLWFNCLLRSLTVALPVILAGLLLAYWIYGKVQSTLKIDLAERLSEQVDQRLSQLVDWENAQIERAGAWCQQTVAMEGMAELLAYLEGSSPEDATPTSASLDLESMRDRLRASLSRVAGEAVDFSVWNRRMESVLDSGMGVPAERLDSLVNPALGQTLVPALRGQSRMCMAGSSGLGWDSGGQSQPPPLQSIVMPLRGSEGEVVGVMMLRAASIQRRLNQMIAEWNQPTGFTETYLVSQQGALITPSRYGEILPQLELPKARLASLESRPENPRSAAERESAAPVAILVRDPGVNLLEDRRSPLQPVAWPPTFMALQVTSGNSGLNVDGYRNYVGADVVGAWRWIPHLNIGLAIEEHFDDAFALADWNWRAMGLLTALFAFCTAGVAFLSSMRLVKGGWRDLSDAGPYQVQELLGQGGMGRVYLAEHALLCRQSAVKVLSGPEIDASAINRFEREVQLASQLTHPNTIAIYDFGRNQEGLFYYAMEYINGAHLGQLIEYAGPIHPGRCIYILSQLCRALSEAHHAGVVHRDIKPQNVMVCNRGGEPDFVKLFDYGLVKAFAPGVTPTASQTKIVVGTPRFMAPERLTSPWLADPRVDIYSIGALAYYLLTAKLPPLFTMSGEASTEHPGNETLDLPTGLVEFGELLGICLSSEPGNRPSSMKSLLDSLEELSERFPWSRQDSAVWWAKHEPKLLQLVKSKQKKLVAKLAADR